MRFFVLALALAATACNTSSSDKDESSADEKKDKKKKSSKDAASKDEGSAKSSAPEAPKGPVFKATVMGVEQAQPIVELDLTAAEMPGYKIMGPDKAQVRKASLGGGAELVSAGVNYSISIREGVFDAGNIKEVYKVLDDKGKILVDTPDLVMFQRESGSVIFSMGLTVGDTKLTCGTVATAFNFDRATIDQTIESCKSLKKVGGPDAPASAPAPSADAPPPSPAPAAKPAAPAPKAKPAAPKACNCPKGDLMCAMKCSAK
jgi:hypothetical protein